MKPGEFSGKAFGAIFMADTEKDVVVEWTDKSGVRHGHAVGIGVKSDGTLVVEAMSSEPTSAPASSAVEDSGAGDGGGSSGTPQAPTSAPETPSPEAVFRSMDDEYPRPKE